MMSRAFSAYWRHGQEKRAFRPLQPLHSFFLEVVPMRSAIALRYTAAHGDGYNSHMGTEGISIPAHWTATSMAHWGKQRERDH